MVEENHEKISAKIVCYQVEIRTRNLLYTNQKSTFRVNLRGTICSLNQSTSHDKLRACVRARACVYIYRLVHYVLKITPLAFNINLIRNDNNELQSTESLPYRNSTFVEGFRDIQESLFITFHTARFRVDQSFRD